jgi:hypothetical protein
MLLLLRVFPLLIVPFVLYLLTMLGGASGLASGHAAVTHLTVAGSALALNAGDIVSIVTVIALALDLGADASTGTTAIIRLCLDGGLAVIFILLLLLASQFATASFLLLTIAALIEFMIGAAIMVTSARRDVSYGSDR